MENLGVTEVDAIELKKAIERMRTCKATLAQSVPVRERHGSSCVECTYSTCKAI
jgi:hypothetical protein